jgi:hypothetical protein
MKTVVNMGDVCRMAAGAAISLAPDWAMSWYMLRLVQHACRSERCLQLSEDQSLISVNFMSPDWVSSIRYWEPEERRSVEAWIEPWMRKANGQARVAIARGEPLYVVSFDPLMDDMSPVADWLDSLPEQDPRMVAKVPRLTWSQALEHSRKWHERLARVDAEKARLVGDPDACEVVLDHGNGYRWVKLLTPEAKDYEGAMMGHCVGSGGYDGEDTIIFSLRDAKNEPRVTIEAGYYKIGPYVDQVKGRGNQPVAERYCGMVIKFIESLSPFEVRDAANFGCYWLYMDDVPRLLVLANPDDARVLAEIKAAARAGDMRWEQRVAFVDI